VTHGWKKLHNEELHNLCFSYKFWYGHCNKKGHVSHMVEDTKRKIWLGDHKKR